MAGRTISRAHQRKIDKDDAMLRARYKETHKAAKPLGESTLTDPSTARRLDLNQTLEIPSSDINLERLIYRVANTDRENPDARFTVSQSNTGKIVEDVKFIDFSKDGSGFKIMFKPNKEEMATFKTSEGTINVTFSSIHKETPRQAPQEVARTSFGQTVVSQQTVFAPATQKPQATELPDHTSKVETKPLQEGEEVTCGKDCGEDHNIQVLERLKKSIGTDHKFDVWRDNKQVVDKQEISRIPSSYLILFKYLAGTTQAVDLKSANVRIKRESELTSLHVNEKVEYGRGYNGTVA